VAAAIAGECVTVILDIVAGQFFVCVISAAGAGLTGLILAWTDRRADNSNSVKLDSD
jgi:uncharacterized membrane protein